MDPRAVAREVTVSAGAVEAGPSFPADYVERARAAAGALTPFEPADGELVAAVRLLQVQAGLDRRIPVAGTWWPRRSGQLLVGRLVDWYLNFLGVRVGEMAQAAVRNGGAISDRLDRIEGRRTAGRKRLQAEVAALRARIAELEERLGAGPSGDGAGPPPTR